MQQSDPNMSHRVSHYRRHNSDRQLDPVGEHVRHVSKSSTDSSEYPVNVQSRQTAALLKNLRGEQNSTFERQCSNEGYVTPMSRREPDTEFVKCDSATRQSAARSTRKHKSDRKQVIMEYIMGTSPKDMMSPRETIKSPRSEFDR